MLLWLLLLPLLLLLLPLPLPLLLLLLLLLLPPAALPCALSPGGAAADGDDREAGGNSRSVSAPMTLMVTAFCMPVVKLLALRPAKRTTRFCASVRSAAAGDEDDDEEEDEDEEDHTTPRPLLSAAVALRLPSSTGECISLLPPR